MTLDLRQLCRAARVSWALFQDPLHGAFFGCCTTEGAQNYYSAFIISRDLSARTSLWWASVLRKNVTALVLLTFIGNINKHLKCLKLCSKNFDEIWQNSYLNNEYGVAQRRLWHNQISHDRFLYLKIRNCCSLVKLFLENKDYLL